CFGNLSFAVRYLSSKCKQEQQKKEVIGKTSRLSRKTVEIMVDRVNSYPCPKWTIRDAEQTIKQFNSSIEVTAISNIFFLS
uniref:Uncharacterized protein n=1 Tax=Romanomermis culicivorax TaxID=13658 RepID=A0A915JHE0_ROMCU